MKDIGAVALTLFPGVVVMTQGKTWEKEQHIASGQTDTDKLKEGKATRKRHNKELQKGAEIMEENKDYMGMANAVNRCNAALRHLVTFRTLIREGVELKQTIAICTFKKQAKEKDMVKEWARIRRWVTGQKETPHCAIVITIGRNTKGWYFLRCIAVGEYMTVSSFLYALGHYLTNSRRKWDKWSTKDILLKKEWDKWRSYYQYEGATTEETIFHFLDELFGVYRTSLMLEKYRTYRNSYAKDILERCSMPVPYECSYAVNAPHIEGNSLSGVALCAIETDNTGHIVNAYPIHLGEGEEV